MRDLKRAAWLLAIVPAPFAMGCMDFEGSDVVDEGGSHEITAGEVDAENGMVSINGCSAENGLTAENGISAENGVSAENGLTTENGLSTQNGLMTTDGGRQTLSYLVKCALRSGETLVKGAYTFPGALGLAPEWKTGSCNTACKENLSACMMAHVNTTGNHYGLWLIGPQTALGWGRSNARPFIEAAFFGNLFTSPPKAYFCEGPDYERVPVRGRIGAATSTTIFKNPFSGGDGMCNDYCANNADGYTSCTSSYTRPITVYRDLDTVNSYSICEGEGSGYQGYTASCLSNSSSSVTLATPSSTSTAQRWKFERYNTSTKEGRYRIKNVSTGKYLQITTTTGSLSAGSSSTSTGQQWNLKEITLGTLANGSFGIQNYGSGKYIDDYSYSNGSSVTQTVKPTSGCAEAPDCWYVGQAWKLKLFAQ